MSAPPNPVKLARQALPDAVLEKRRQRWGGKNISAPASDIKMETPERANRNQRKMFLKH